MSVCKWGIVGLGFDMDDLSLNYERILDRLNPNWVQEGLNEDAFSSDEMVDYLEGSFNAVSEYAAKIGEKLFDEALSNQEYDALFNMELELEFVSDRYDKNYLIYAARMPWEIREDVPKSQDEMEALILKLVQPLTTQKDEELAGFINYINTSGEG